MVSNPLLFLFAFATLIGTSIIIGAIALVVLSGEGLGPENGCRHQVTGEVRPVSREVTDAESFQNAWNQIAEQVSAGQTEVTIQLTESEVSSRADDYLDERDSPVKDVLVCFHDGYAEGRAKVEMPGAGDIPVVGGVFDTEARIIGTLDMSGQHPRLAISDFDAGDLPGIVEDEVRDEVEDALNERLTDLALQYDYQLTFIEGQATVTAAVPIVSPQ